MKTPDPLTRRQILRRFTASLAVPAMGTAAVGAAAAHEAGGPVKVTPLMKRELAGHQGEEVTMVMVDIPPGAESKPHRHPGPVFVYVAEGTVEMQITDGPLTTLRAGETFYEPPGVVHLVSRNPSTKASAKLVAFIVGKTGAAAASPVE